MIPSQFLSYSITTFLTSQIWVLFFNPSNPISVPNTMGYVFFCSTVVSLPWAIPLKTTNTPCCSNKLLLGWRQTLNNFPFFPWNWTSLSLYRSCACFCTHFEFIYAATLLCPEDTIFFVKQCLWFSHSFWHFFYNDP